MAKIISNDYTPTGGSSKRKGVHAKSKHSKSKTSKNYVKPYKGQGK